MDWVLMVKIWLAPPPKKPPCLYTRYLPTISLSESASSLMLIRMIIMHLAGGLWIRQRPAGANGGQRREMARLV